MYKAEDAKNLTDKNVRDKFGSTSEQQRKCLLVHIEEEIKKQVENCRYEVIFDSTEFLYTCSYDTLKNHLEWLEEELTKAKYRVQRNGTMMAVHWRGIDITV